MARLMKQYQQEVVPALIKEFGYKNPMTVPRLLKVVVNMGVGEAIQNAKVLDAAGQDLASITGQKAIIRRAKRSVAAFHLREGMPIGLKVTLRRERMWEFLDRLINIGLARVRDFRGVPLHSFDGRGNYTLGLKDQLIFPEIDLGKTEEMRGMNVTIVTSAETDDEARFLLKSLGMPFARQVERRAAVAV